MVDIITDTHLLTIIAGLLADHTTITIVKPNQATVQKQQAVNLQQKQQHHLHKHQLKPIAIQHQIAPQQVLHQHHRHHQDLRVLEDVK